VLCILTSFCSPVARIAFSTQQRASIHVNEAASKLQHGERRIRVAIYSKEAVVLDWERAELLRGAAWVAHAMHQ